MHRRSVVGIAGLVAVAALTIPGQAYVTFGSWSTSQVPYYINAANQDVAADAAEYAIQAGANAWSAQTSANFRFNFAGRTNDTTAEYDGRNVVFFRNSANSSAIATTYYWTSNGRLLDADIIFWDGGWTFFTGTSGCSSGAYIEDIAAHEFGHALGMRHTEMGGATMYPSYNRCSQELRTLSADDIAGVESLYPAAATNAAPSVQITAPNQGSTFIEGASVTLAGSASDPEDGNLNAGIVWMSSRDGYLGTGHSLSRVLSTGSHTITATASDTGGQSTTRQVTTSVQAAANGSPSVSITAPTSGTTVPAGATVTFTGTASDPEDGALTSKLVWNSDKDGPLGMGGTVLKSLTSGTHAVSASVTDTKGFTTTKQIGLTVASTTPSPTPAPTTFWAAGRGFKTKGVQHAEVTWGGTTATMVDIYRDGAKVATTSNDGSYVNAINRKGGGRYSYMVCAASTQTCSNAVLVSF